MAVRGTRFIFGNEAKQRSDLIYEFRKICDENHYQELIVPILASQETFVAKAGSEILGQMYTFPDKKNRQLCLIPEVTGVIQELYDDNFFNAYKKPIRLFYISRCYRYERPQEGRYREFTQIGIEILSDNITNELKEESINLLKTYLTEINLKKFEFNSNVKRGLSYYIEDGFEVECNVLGAQKQIAGGGKYKQGIGWAIGLDRLVIALNK